MHASSFGGSRLSPAHWISPANAPTPVDRLSAPPPDTATKHQRSPSSPFHFASRAAEEPYAPEPMKPSSEKSVMFDLQPQEFEFTPESEKAPERPREREGERRGGRTRERDSKRDRGQRDGSADSSASDETIDLPPRFDELGRPVETDPLAQKLEAVLSGLFR